MTKSLFTSASTSWTFFQGPRFAVDVGFPPPGSPEKNLCFLYTLRFCGFHFICLWLCYAFCVLFFFSFFSLHFLHFWFCCCCHSWGCRWYYIFFFCCLHPYVSTVWTPGSVSSVPLFFRLAFRLNTPFFPHQKHLGFCPSSKTISLPFLTFTVSGIFCRLSILA